MLIQSYGWSQDLSRDVDFLETQNTLSTPFDVPLYVSPTGEVNLLSNDLNSTFSFSPMAQGNARVTKSIYIKPIVSDGFAFREQRQDKEWIEIRRERGELGLGISADIGAGISLGLAPFKGARNVMTRTKSSQTEKTKRPKMPDTLEEVREWRDGDLGSFQRFGGLQVSAGYGVPGLNIITVGLVIQNLWSINIRKDSGNKIILSLAEENLKKRRIQSGSMVAQGKIHFFKGKRMSAHFVLDPEDELHQRLYKDAIKGRLDLLQGKLPHNAQKMTWKGSERMFYFGIPTVIGKHFQRSEYVMQFDDVEEVLDVKTKRNAGIFLPMRSHTRLVYQTDETMTIFWYSEMNKADLPTVDKHFLRPGRLMGVRGFDTTSLPSGNMIGATLSQIGMSFTREEIAKIDRPLLDEILDHFMNRCRELDLSCARTKRFNKIKKKLVSFIGKKWVDMRDDLGYIMVDEPALVNAYLKAIGAKKKIYFKFLNQKFQSLEGTAPIET